MKEDSLSIKKVKVVSFGLKLFIINQSGQEIARTFLYIMHNDLHDRPFALLEDVFVSKNARGQGYRTTLIKKATAEARRLNCYKLVATSRHQRPTIHHLYLKLGFIDWGREFRLDF